MKQALGFVLSLAVLLAAFISCERFFSPSFKECIAHHQAHGEGDSAKENPAGFFGPVSAYAECTGDFIDKNNGSITALATIIIAAFTATLWRATTAQGILAREAFIADKKPFVFPDAINSYWDPSTTNPGQYDWRFRPVWNNSGETPPKNLIIQTNCELRNTILPANYTFTSNVATGSGLLGPKTRAPGGLAPAHPLPAITPQDIVDVQEGRKFLYLWGWAKYEDGFPETPHHLTHFCWAINPIGKPLEYVPGTVAPAQGSLSFDYTQTQEGNYTRDE
jgi:hypothetical protein